MRVFGRILKHFVILKILAFFYLFLRTYDIMIIYLNVVIYLKKKQDFVVQMLYTFPILDEF